MTLASSLLGETCCVTADKVLQQGPPSRRCPLCRRPLNAVHSLDFPCNLALEQLLPYMEQAERAISTLQDEVADRPQVAYFQACLHCRNFKHSACRILGTHHELLTLTAHPSGYTNQQIEIVSACSACQDRPPSMLCVTCVAPLLFEAQPGTTLLQHHGHSSTSIQLNFVFMQGLYYW